MTTAMLALRSSLYIDALNADGLGAAHTSAADGILIDLASPASYVRRADARRAGNHALEALVAQGVQVFARVSDYRSGETEDDVMSIVRPGIAAVLLAGEERPQDARAVDVAIRKQEMRRGIEPGSVRLIAEVDSAAGLRALPKMLDAIDRHLAVALDATAFARDLMLPGESSARLGMLEHAMGELTLTCTVAGIVWTLAAPGDDEHVRRTLTALAHAYGAAGAVVTSEAEAEESNGLFTPEPDEVATARRIATEWDALHSRGEHAAIADGRVVDRRTKDHARLLVARADAIAARTQVRV